MPRNRIFGIYVLLGVVALGAGMLVAQIFGTNASLPSDYATQAPVAQASTAVAPPTQLSSSAPTAPPLQPSDSPTAVPAPTLTPSELPTASPAPTVAPTPSPEVASDPGFIEYTVQRGDILKEIAQRYDVTVTEIIAVNQIPNPDSLVVASVIRIPKK